MDLVNTVLKYVKKEYKTEPDMPWKKYPDNQVLRHGDTGKWFGLILPVKRNKLGLTGEDVVFVLDLKCDPIMAGDLRSNPGIFPGYHMNHSEWISILLDGTVEPDMICNLIDISYELTASKTVKQKLRGPKNWLVPANPKYYDIIHAFDDTDIITWKQSSDIRVGDIVYLYVAAPVSAILYKCKALEVKIPSDSDYGLNIKWIMKIQLLQRYDPETYTMKVLKEYGVYAVRGPRSMPDSLVYDIDL